jgi:hypothetical protein
MLEKNFAPPKKKSREFGVISKYFVCPQKVTKLISKNFETRTSVVTKSCNILKIYMFFSKNQTI